MLKKTLFTMKLNSIFYVIKQSYEKRFLKYSSVLNNLSKLQILKSCCEFTLM